MCPLVSGWQTSDVLVGVTKLSLPFMQQVIPEARLIEDLDAYPDQVKELMETFSLKFCKTIYL